MYAQLKNTTRTLIALLALTAGVNAHAQGPKAKPTPAPAPAPSATQGDKLDVSDLENKYWAAKDTDFNVVQNRLFSKEGRLALTLNYGMYVGEPWSEGATAGASLNYFFSERYGIEAAYSMTDSKDNQATDAVQQQGGSPNHNKMKDFYGVAFNWVPFYAKVSVLNSKIMYFDMSVSPGVGMQTYDQQLEEGNQSKTTPAITLDITQHYFLTKWMAIRIDYKNRWWNEDVVSWRNNASRTTTKDLNNTGLLMLGATFYF
jgi:outer membrane beta-barrel protein